MLEQVRTDEQVRRDITARMSLRLPQEHSLAILSDVLKRADISKRADPEATLASIKAAYPSVEEFERDFPSLCFALATGVGKTRLMGAFITYLYLTGRSTNFFVLAPNTTIYDKLCVDFTPGTRKYVFKGIAEFASNQPVVVTGDTWDQSDLLVRGAQANGGAIINVFNVDKINKDGGRVRKLNEYIGESYFAYLSGLPDLVLLMDEAHRYRANAGFRAVADLNPVLGLELTATPKTVGARSVDFKNVIYRFGLREAMEHGFIKEPAVATRANFDPKEYVNRPDDLERIKLEDGIHAHEQVRVELAIYAKDTGKPLVHPFMLVVAQDTAHAQRIRELIQSDAFFNGAYKDKVIEVHSALRGEELDDATTRLVALETDPSTEIVIHVNKLKEGWDVTNLFTIVPLRASASDILTEQTLGRGLRLPYGQRTGVEPIDRLTVIAHDRFDDVIKAAKEPGSIVQMKSVIIGANGDVPAAGAVLVEAPSLVDSALTGNGVSEPHEPFLLTSAEDRAVATVTLQVIQGMERKLGGVADLGKADVQAEIVARVQEITKPAQSSLAGIAGPTPDVAKIVAKVAEHVAAGTIEIPEIVVLPDSRVSFTFRDFNMTGLDSIAYRPLADEIMIQKLRTEEKSYIAIRMAGIKQERLEDYLVAQLIGYPEIDYDEHADLLYKLSGQVVGHLTSYLQSADDVEKVLLDHGKRIGEFVHQQMMDHYEETPTTYRWRMEKGFQVLKPQRFNQPNGQPVLDFRTAVNPRSDTRKRVFQGFKKCCYGIQSFQSDDERRFAVLVDDTSDVLRWVKPARKQFMIDYLRGKQYEPDFVIETSDAKLIAEVKARNEMEDPDVVAKARAARTWVGYANDHAAITGGKPWKYVLIPHDSILGSSTLAGLINSFEQLPIHGGATAG
jgi:type III restriction enzyme